MRSLPPRLALCLALLAAALLAACAPPMETARERPQQSLRATAPAGQGGIALTWEPPQDRTDGTPLPHREIAGYRVYMGKQPGELALAAEVEPARTSVVIDGLEPDRQYFIALTTLDRDGRESPKSREIRETARPLQELRMAGGGHRP